MAPNLRNHLDTACQIAFDAGRLTLGYFQRRTELHYKADDSPVTQADREAEQLIRRQLEARYPTHAILGEEFGEDRQGASQRWIIDPIDGTKSFMRGVPLYTVLLALEIEGRCELGVVYNPVLDEMVYAATGEGCWWNGRRCQLSQENKLDRSIVSYTDALGFANNAKEEAWQRLQKATYYRPGWTDAYGYMLVATGRIEIMIDPAMHPWDAAPFPAIFREAGGYFGDWKGNETIFANEALATTRTLLPEVLELLNA